MPHRKNMTRLSRLALVQWLRDNPRPDLTRMELAAEINRLKIVPDSKITPATIYCYLPQARRPANKNDFVGTQLFPSTSHREFATFKSGPTTPITKHDLQLEFIKSQMKLLSYLVDQLE